MNKPLAIHHKDAYFKILGDQTFKGYIHTWVHKSQQMILLKVLDLAPGTLVPVFPGEFLSYMTNYGVLDPILRA